jgi:hypothetical protein
MPFPVEENKDETEDVLAIVMEKFNLSQSATTTCFN